MFTCSSEFAPDISLSRADLNSINRIYPPKQQLSREIIDDYATAAWFLRPKGQFISIHKDMDFLILDFPNLLMRFENDASEFASKKEREIVIK